MINSYVTPQNGHDEWFSIKHEQRPEQDQLVIAYYQREGDCLVRYDHPYFRSVLVSNGLIGLPTLPLKWRPLRNGEFAQMERLALIAKKDKENKEKKKRYDRELLETERIFYREYANNARSKIKVIGK